MLILNAGSTSIKASIYAATLEPLAAIWSARVESIGEATTVSHNGKTFYAPEVKDHAAAIDWIMREVKNADGLRIASVGHRIVHGGIKYSAPTVVDQQVLMELRALISLAPQHQPHGIAGIVASSSAFPDAVQVACFDTAFHRSMPEVERLFALPWRYAEKGVIRYGFHGLSYAHIARVLPKHLGAAADGRIIVGHLGAGVSLCAMRNRRSVATTMGFTALDGPPMGTRCGAIDPGVLLYLIEREGLGAEQLSNLLYEESGLLGVSGLSGDMRVLLASKEPRAGKAIDLFAYRMSREIGSLAAVLGGVDAFVFTGGIGENAAPIREQICSLSSWLGMDIDHGANARGETIISSASSRVPVLVLRTDEACEIAIETVAFNAAS